MINIILVCNAGMSTSVLVKKMRDESEKRGIDTQINAYSVETLEEVLKTNDADCILVGPQIRYMLSNIKKIVSNQCPVDVIDMKDYGTINGVAVLDKALSMKIAPLK